MMYLCMAFKRSSANSGTFQSLPSEIKHTLYTISFIEDETYVRVSIKNDLKPGDTKSQPYTFAKI